MADANATRLRGSLAIVAACLPVLCAAAAIAAAPVKGGSYRGTLTGSRSAIRVSFRVANSGTSISQVNVSALPLYCSGKPPPTARISFSGAPISAHGTFTAAGTDKIGVGPLKGSAIATLKLTGTFAANHTESGVLTTTLAGGSSAHCSGHSNYRTKAS
jgi:hypothetical protein